jgi:hypothetical protein
VVPTIGRIVLYTLSEDDAKQINKRRKDAHDAGTARLNTGAVVHFGNTVNAGDVFPMVIVRVFGAEPTSGVNGQVLLDGNDTFWATSRVQGEGPFRWNWPPRV